MLESQGQFKRRRISKLCLQYRRSSDECCDDLEEEDFDVYTGLPISPTQRNIKGDDDCFDELEEEFDVLTGEAVSPTQLKFDDECASEYLQEDAKAAPTQKTELETVEDIAGSVPRSTRELGDGPMTGLFWKCTFCKQLVPKSYDHFSSRVIEQRISHFRKCANSDSLVNGKTSGRNASISESGPLVVSSPGSPIDSGKPKDAFSILMKNSNSSSSRKTSSIRAKGVGVGGNTGVAHSKRNAFAVLMAGSSSTTKTSLPTPSASARGWSRRVTKDPSKVPHFKLLPVGPGVKPIVIDGFQYADEILSETYFLSHFHSDHYVGLKKSFSAGIIYCTEVTARLLLQQFKINPKYVCGLKMNEPIKLDCGAIVTLMDANHCPGSCIMLFQIGSTPPRYHLHTGDFRYVDSMPLHPAFSQVSSIDRLYLDTTYCDPSYNFPSQEESIRSTLTALDKHLSTNRSKTTLFLFGSYSIGKEKVFMAAAEHCGAKMYVSSAKMRLIHCFGWSDTDMKRLTRDVVSTNFHVLSMGQLNFKRIGVYLATLRRRYTDVVAFRPTGWAFGGRGYGGKRSRAVGSGGVNLNGISSVQQKRVGNGVDVTIYGIAYSEHSSFSELQASIHAFRPLATIPTVNGYTLTAVRQMLTLLGVQ